MKGKELILQEFQKLDLYNMSEEMIVDMKNQLLQNVNMIKLEHDVKQAILNLSRVAPPSYGADALYIALDNQARLEIIYQLLDTFELFKAQTNNLKRNKHKCNTDNFEYVFSYLTRTQDLLETIYKYTEFRHQEKIENQKAIAEHNTKLLQE